jgi:hypothetical protein
MTPISMATLLFFLGASLAAYAEEDIQNQQSRFKTYNECILDASRKNMKWTQYKIDVNKCRSEFNLPGLYQ